MRLAGLHVMQEMMARLNKVTHPGMIDLFVRLDDSALAEEVALDQQSN